MSKIFRTGERALYVHVGQHKTGTSTIQYFISRNRAILQRHGVFVPGKLVGPNVHHDIARTLWNTQPSDVARKRFLDVIASILDQAGSCPRVLLSSEVFSTGHLKLHNEHLKLFSEHFDSVHLIYYMRRQDDALMSGYNQLIKSHGRKEPFAEPSSPAPYMEAIEGLLDDFGVSPDAMTIRVYEKEQLLNGDLLADFLDTMDLQLTDDYVIRRDPNNTSLSRNALEYKRYINGLTPTSLPLKEQRLLEHRFAHALGEYSSQDRLESNTASMSLISPQRRREILLALREDYAQIARMYMGRNDGSLFRRPGPDLDEPWEPYTGLSEDSAAQITEVICARRPELLHELRQLCLHAATDDPYASEAKQVLQPGIIGLPQTEPQVRTAPARRKTIYLHIGMPKTGTTALQHLCHANAKLLAEHGILYPKAGSMSGAHHLFAYSLWKRKVYWWQGGSCTSPRAVLEEMISEADQCNCDNILISSELLMYLPREGTTELLVDALSDFDVKIICYVRRMDRFLCSAVRQTIKALSGQFSIDAINKGKSIPVLDHVLDMRGYLAEWLAAFPTENFILRPYEKSQLQNNDIQADFLRILGLELTDDFAVSRQNPNPRMTNDALEYKRLINIVFAESPEKASPFIQELLDYSASVDATTKAVFGPEDANIIAPEVRLNAIQQSADLCVRIARDYLGRADGQLFYDPLPDPSEPWVPYPGLSPAKAEEITSFLRKSNGKLVRMLEKQLSNQPKRNAEFREAEKILRPGVCEPGFLRRLFTRTRKSSEK